MDNYVRSCIEPTGKAATENQDIILGVKLQAGINTGGRLSLEYRESSLRFISIRHRGRRRWQDKPEAQQTVYGNRRRMCGERGKQLLRRRGELHAYETGGMRRVHLRGRENVLKRVLIHVGAFDLSLVMRQLLGKGTPRGWQGSSADHLLALLRLWIALLARSSQPSAAHPIDRVSVIPPATESEATSATDC